MELFNKKYVHFMWEDELEGKEGFFSDNSNDLKCYVNTGSTFFFSGVRRGTDENPFLTDNGRFFKFFYYDPNYKVKQAYRQGKPIEVKSPTDGKWYVTVEPCWDDDVEYRIKPEHCCSDCHNLGCQMRDEGRFQENCEDWKAEVQHMTYRQLAEWAAKGYGEVREKNVISTYVSYVPQVEGMGVDDDYKIRRWGSDEWLEPTVDIYATDMRTIEE